MKQGLALSLVAAAFAHPAERHIGRWTAPPVHVPTQYITDTPIVGNGDLGVCFAGPPGNTTFFVTTNSFWSSNISPGRDPAGHSEYYSQVPISRLHLVVDGIASTDSYSASQELYRARINSTAGSAGSQFAHTTFVAADENTAVISIRTETARKVSLQLTGLPTVAPAFPLPEKFGTRVSASEIYMTKDSVTTTTNPTEVSKCFISGQGEEMQLFSVVNGEVTGTDWKLVPGEGQFDLYMGATGKEKPYASSSVEGAAAACLADPKCAGYGIRRWAANASLYASAQSLEPLGDTSGNFWTKRVQKKAGLNLQSKTSGKCLGVTTGERYLKEVECDPSATLFDYHTDTQHIMVSGGVDDWEHAWNTTLNQGPRCITRVRDNPLVSAAVVARVVSEGGPVQIHSSADGSVNFEVSAGVGYDVIVSVGTVGTCDGCTPGVSDPLQLAERMADKTEAEVASLRSGHQQWWERYWNASSIDLGPKYSLLESFYYGMQYQIGSASRAGKTAPGLWGPWLTDSLPGWSGDYTLNYNFEANFFGVFSDNRPELAQPFYPIIQRAVPVARWRAGMKYWGSGPPDMNTASLTPGGQSQDFNLMLDITGRPVPANFSGVQFNTHLSPWESSAFNSDWGQKSVGAFCSKAFIDNFEYTQNTTFLREETYPLLRMVGDFYLDYATKDSSGRYNVLHSCAQEGCYTGTPYNGIKYANNPPMDLAFSKMVFKSLVKYSKILGVDKDMVPSWQDYLKNIVDYPTQTSERGTTVFAQNNAPGGFPNASHCAIGKDISQCGNARYPIVHFNAMFPAEDVDLTSDSTLVEIARETVDIINDINHYSPSNGMCLAWPPAVRVVHNVEGLLANFTKAVNETMLPNFFPFIKHRPTSGYGCNIENAGATLAVNELLVAVHGGALRLFPGGWPAGSPVSFTTLRVKGGFLVSHESSSATTVIESLAGSDCTLYWKTAPTVTTAAGQSVKVSAVIGAVDTYLFETTAGVRYLVV